ncbi:MAG TPA: VWA domain-containing protein [Terriglobia bacterium]|jgi:VWFA-related protein
MKSIVFPILLASLAAMVPAAAPVPQRDTVRADVNVVSIYFTVRDKRERLVTGLTKDAFKVVENGKPQQISFFADHNDLPMNVGVLLDTSTVMARTLGLEANAASQFFRTVMRPNDQGFLVSYAAHVETLQVPIEDAVRLADRAQDIRKGARIFDDGPLPTQGTPRTTQPFPIPGRLPVPVTMPPNIPDTSSLRVAKLYDAVNESVERFLSPEFGRKVLVIAALADDAHSESTLRDALKTLKENDVIAYVLEVQHAPRSGRDDCDIRHIFRNEDEFRISRLAVETGGRVIRVEGFEKMQAAFEQIADELHHQYSIGYRPANQDWDGAFRKVSIDAGKRFKVSARDGYYANLRH